ncbi:hypothetical protein DO97_19945 [Neosynechococcus sphagnicola sy1]|uniref:Uncharacterized protein n=1 Tax=Neosynechococcus sphagnicola sy1 TaxID=1497020 RepID=A0A098TNC9_9CYAN|nr:hypothetical protein [Neosynechococcus sphagnicola]KGF73372.1 hypothetical protein DO97_19945 [Neosynechococcus sphagnicola sy1]
MQIFQFFRQHQWTFLSIWIPIFSLGIYSLPVNAEGLKLEYRLPVSQGQSFDQFLRQAEIITAQIVKNTFVKNAQVTEVNLQVIGERNGQEALLLLLKVSRSDWKKLPVVQQWTQRFTIAKVLLGFVNSYQPAQLGGAIASPIPSSPAAPGTSLVNDPAFRDD